jgi:acetate CoA/acetoacetate CoA-transferase alpha subunit
MSKMLSSSAFKDLLFDGMTVMVGGFMAVGTPEVLIDALVESNVKDLTIICNDAGFPDKGVGKLIANHQVSHLIASHIGLNPQAGQMMSEGTMQVTLVPQGTLAERIRCGGAGLGGVLTPTGVGTIVEEGKQIITLDGKDYLLETALHADLAIILGHKVDTLGNTIYAKTTRNFNPVMATAADKVVVYAREIVSSIDPDIIVTPHIFVDHIVKEEG